MDVGIDSLSSTALVDELREKTGLQLSPTLIFEHSTAAAIADHMVQMAGGKGSGPTLFAGVSNGEAAALSVESFCGRFPGGASSVDKLRCLSSCGTEAVGRVPVQRWKVDSSSEYGRTASSLGTMRNAELFDAARFAISSSEAAAMDPQQRVLLEVGYEALVIHGFQKADTRDNDTGVFLGITNADFHAMSAGSSSVYAATGGTISIAAGRLSFTLGFQGPCVSMDTACSSALVALHGAAQAIRASDCNVALTTAVSLYFAPHVSIAYARAGMLSADGRCKTFDASANGYVRGEGVGALMVCGSAETDGQPGVSSSAVRQDGKSASLTAPSGSAQVALLSLAIARAGADGPLLSSVESHGTGTPLGDPTETRALSQAVPLTISLSAIKANVGHLEPAAGMIGLAALMITLSAQKVAPCAKLRVVNPMVAVSTGAQLRLVASNTPLPASECAVVGVSSFGYSGTIAHAILFGAKEPGSRTAPIIGFKRRTYLCDFLPQDSLPGVELPMEHTPMLGVPISSAAAEEFLWEQNFSPYELEFLKNHRVGFVSLLPGTCYIEMGRAVVRVIHEQTGFALTSVKFSTIMFLDDELDSAPTVRVSVHRKTGLLTITSQMEDSPWVSHSTMVLEVKREKKEFLNLPAVRERCTEHVTAKDYYAKCGNDYRGEFKAMEEAWARDGGVEIISKISYGHNENENVHLRTMAWLDTCLHAPYWWCDHRCRPFYIAAVTSYHIRTMDASLNQTMWSVMQGSAGSAVSDPKALAAACLALTRLSSLPLERASPTVCRRRVR